MEHSERLLREIRSEESSIWFSKEGEYLVIIIKSPLNSCKALVNGCGAEILFGLDKTLDQPIVHTGIRIFDDLENPLLLSGTNRFKEENEAFIQILENRGCQVILYSELGLPLIYGQVELGQKSCLEILELLEGIESLYHGDNSDLVIKSLDSFDFSIDPTRKFVKAYKINVIVLDCQFQSWNESNAHFIGINEKYNSTIMDYREGDTLEKHIWFSLENVFLFEIFLNPKINSRSGEKEFTDIFAFYELGTFLIEAKSLSIYNSRSEKSMSRKVLSLQKHIKKAVNQLVGASESIEKGIDIFDSKRNLLKFNRDVVPHCIVLVSELFHFGDWVEIDSLILRRSGEKNVFIHVFDLRELVSLLKTTDGKKELLDYRLIRVCL